jgi:pimeloyl-ACP methyl ester carboxylesterase
MPAKHLVFIHGFLEDSSMWKHILPHLSKSGWVIDLPELPGHGNNSFLPEEKNAKAYCKNILEQIELAPDDEAFIIAHSMGGYLSASLAEMIPTQISGLCFFHSKAGADNEQKIADRKRAIEAARENKSLYVRTMINNIYFEGNRERCKNEMEAQIAYAQNLSIETIVAAQEVMISRPDRVETMLHRNFPLYYFLGDRDSSLPNDVMMAEVSRIPGAVAHLVQGIGHMGHIENKREAVEFIQRIMRAVSI